MLVKKIAQLFKRYTPEEKRLRLTIQQLVGFKPFNLSLYQLALRHTSASKVNEIGMRESNERLEYLGDAVLGAIVAEYLFKRYPFREEGFLTEIRSRIVNRESLNEVARKCGLMALIEFEGSRRHFSHKSIGGDALEALVGAVYLDRGYQGARTFVVERILQIHLDLDEVIENNKNFKSLVIEWAQRENKKLRFAIISEKGQKHQREFIAEVYIDDQPIATGSGFSKKKAEQAAAEKSCEILKIG
ncbi:ribonuclease III [Eisenibacter elegans]|uniref:ribonuclease III n=1 Tax=Eisenibacter elegans TaxID=997 RepID=UPI003CCC1839